MPKPTHTETGIAGMEAHVDFQTPTWIAFEKIVDAKVEERQRDHINQLSTFNAEELIGMEAGRKRESPIWVPAMGTEKRWRAGELELKEQLDFHRQFSPCFEGTQKKVYDAVVSIIDKDIEYVRSSKERFDAAGDLATEDPSKYDLTVSTYENKFIDLNEHVARAQSALGLLRYMKGDQVPERPLVEAEIYLSADEEHKTDYFGLNRESFILEGLQEYGITREEFFQCRPAFPKLETAAILLPDHPAINSQTYSKHFEAGTSTLQEMKYGEDIFDYTFTPIFSAPTQQHGMEELGINKYDLIFINGQSVNELYGDRFKDLSDRQRSAMIQTAVVAAALDGKSHVECCRLQKNGDQYEIAGAMTMKPKLELHEPQLSRWSRFKQALHLEPKVIPKAKQLEDLDKTDFKASARREKIAATAEERIHKKQEQKSSRAKTTLSELSDDRKKERRTEKTAEKTTPVKEKSSDRGMGR